MAADQAKLDSLWKLVEDARLRWKSAHNHVKTVNGHAPTMPTTDGSYVGLRALRDQRLAVEQYLHALQDFRAALASDHGPKPAVTTDGSNGRLTRRERQVLALIAAGKSSKQVAAELGIAFRTAVCHRYRLQQKLNVHNTADLTRAALRMGLVQL